MDRHDEPDRFHAGPQPVVAQLYFDAADLLEEVRQGFVVLHFVETHTDMVLYAPHLEADGESDGTVRLTGRCRLEQLERHCQVELDSVTLVGVVRLMD